MKKILFVIGTMQSGGAEKSLTSLLAEFDYSKYKVDLLLFEKTGLFLDLIPEEVNIIEGPGIIRGLSKEKNLKLFLSREMTLKAFYTRTMATLDVRMKSKKIAINKKNNCQYIWKHWSKVVPDLSEKYDVAIGYLQGFSNYYVMEKVKAKRKIGWIHTDYLQGGYFEEIDKPYFTRMHQIVTVSDECKRTLDNIFPEMKNKITVIENIISKKNILKMSEINSEIKLDPKCINIIGVGRLSPEKGIDMAVEVCRKLVLDGYPVKWYIIGKGPEFAGLQALVEKHDLKDKFAFLGEKSNPYNILKQADIYVQPSRFEGKSIAIEEAKILGLPIVVTNFATVKDQIEDNQTGLIADMSSVSIYIKVKRVIDEKGLSDKLVENLKIKSCSNEREVTKLYQIIDN